MLSSGFDRTGDKLTLTVVLDFNRKPSCDAEGVS